jgi:hypothetical protein
VLIEDNWKHEITLNKFNGFIIKKMFAGGGIYGGGGMYGGGMYGSGMYGMRNQQPV